MTEIDALMPGPADVWAHDTVVVRHSPGREFDAVRADSTVQVTHSLTSADIGESLVALITEQARHLGLSQREFELVLVGIVRTTIADPVLAWSTYYRNSLDELLAGTADFAPVHERAEQLVVGTVLDMGSCFGFFPLRLGSKGRTVTATDLSAGTMRLLATVAPHLAITLDTVVCDAAAIPVADNSVDTVTALHLLEHVDSDTGTRIVTEALRVARSRVVVAIPFETETTVCHGHVRRFDEAALIELGRSTGVPLETSEYHGGWLVIDKARGSARRSA
ncbi:class I SAM-dependent methyltransferase [Rhodococcus fascians]|nr:class I SAM-dependent methyltransferase [Rhodococcus fascians]MBY4140969.1 class I SAM-dependent methyltransferase [Rhodococcus fascians]MBY4219633.1 class I SAM-dependent methyltransferase [Rhodococcus fascians]MBY4221942.1 class I SAM-dependent methyltransferase [Rhodococcus fascians]MBY4233943.1 class I SAM-dependent methyltransferase [Rhodococcus fascians]